MFGWGELGVVIILAIVLLGPDRLPEIFKTLGKIYYEYKKARKRFELEVLYGYKLPDKDLLDKLSQKRIDEIMKAELESKGREWDENIKKLLLDRNTEEKTNVDQKENSAK
ncbi:MAG: twin-arginine translocase TatA/TatE family subunit [Archaeoglobus sp.]|nr:twin-arginine translocase TatA/TatE family subunit [Archaeoglobus sp.]